MNINSNYSPVPIEIQNNILQSALLEWQKIIQTFVDQKIYGYFEYIEAMYKRIYLEKLMEKDQGADAGIVRKHIAFLDKTYYENTYPLDGFIKCPNTLIERYFFSRMPLGIDRFFKDELAKEDIQVASKDYFKKIFYLENTSTLE